MAFGGVVCSVQPPLRLFPALCARLVIGALAALSMVLAGLPARAAPHPLLTASAIATITRDGGVEVVVRCDSLAFALGELPQTIDDNGMLAVLAGPRTELERVYAESRERFASGFQLHADGAVVPLRELLSPTADQALAWQLANPKAVLPVKLEFTARATLPRGSTKLTLRFPQVLGDVVLTVQTPGEEPLAALVRAGDSSDEYVYNLSAPIMPGTVPPTIGAVGGSDVVSATAPPEPAAPARRPAPSIGSLKSALGFIFIGFEHIIPAGLDHILFVLGLFFLTPKLKPLLVQITCFTIAHSVTLALSARGVFTLPASIVEPAIAASIAFVAVENLCTQKVHAWRPIVVLCFGLLHGLGFASAFAEALGTSTAPLGPVLLFNVGVELGQLAVVALALLAVGWFQTKPWYRARLAIPASALIAGMGVYWFIERIFF